MTLRTESAPFDRMLTTAMADAHADWRSVASADAGTAVVSGSEGAVRPFAVLVTADELRADLITKHFGPAVVLCQAPVASYGRATFDLLRRVLAPI